MAVGFSYDFYETLEAGCRASSLAGFALFGYYCPCLCFGSGPNSALFFIAAADLSPLS